MMTEWELDMLEEAQMFSDHLKESLCHAAQQDLFPIHPFPQNALRNAKQKNPEEIVGTKWVISRIISPPCWYISTSYLSLTEIRDIRWLISRVVTFSG